MNEIRENGNPPRQSATESREEIQALRARLEEAEATLNAMRNGEVDAVVVSGPDGDQVYTLRGADEPYRLILQTMTEGAFTASADGTILYGNQRLADMLGVPLELLIGASLLTYVSADERPALAEFLQEVSHGVTLKRETRLSVRYGSLIPCKISAVPLKMEGDRGVSAVVTDLTERKLAEASLRAAQGELEQRVMERTAQLGESNRQLAVEIQGRQRNEDRIRRRNQILAGIGRIFHEALESRTEVELGRVCLKVAEELTQSRFGFIGELHPTEARIRDLVISDPGWEDCAQPSAGGHGLTAPSGAALQGLYGKVIKEGRGFFTNQPASHPASAGVPAGHPPLTAFLGVPLITGDKPTGMIGLGNREGGYSADDIEVVEALAPAIVQALLRKRAEAALKESEERFREAANGLPLPLWVYNAAGEHEFVNTAFREFFGITLEDLKDGQWTVFVHPEDRDAYVGEFQACLREHRLFRAECRAKRADGQWRWIESYARPRFAPSGEFLGFVGASPDITERKRAEERILRHNDELERLVAERTTQIQKLERQRQENEKQAAVGRMAARIAHEINNPLAGIKNSFLLVKRGISPDFKHYSFVERIEKEIDRVARIVRQMFELYKPERKEPMLFNPGEVIRDVAALLEGNRRNQGVTLVLDTAGSASHVRFHEDSLRQVLFNVVQNAIEATPQGGTVTVAATTEADRLTITVEDTGCGIPAGAQPHVFEPFFTTKSGLTTGGLGLGLSVTHGLVDSLGGTISFTSELNRGTTFRIVFPVETAPDVLLNQP